MTSRTIFTNVTEPKFSKVYGWVEPARKPLIDPIKISTNSAIASSATTAVDPNIVTGLNTPTAYSKAYISPEMMAWNRLNTPRWSSFYLREKAYESKYGIDSSAFYNLFRNGQLSQLRIDENEAHDWLNIYRLMAD